MRVSRASRPSQIRFFGFVRVVRRSRVIAHEKVVGRRGSPPQTMAWNVLRLRDIRAFSPP
jgi:hypothetical protein